MNAMAKTTRSKKLRKASAAEFRRFGLPAGHKMRIETVDLEDPNLAPEHRDNFIGAIRAEIVRLDELIDAWYRHCGECNIPDCDCGGDELAEPAQIVCSHLLAVKELFGQAIIDDFPCFARFVRECEGGGDKLYAALTSQPVGES
jgi:hypothetical protein